MRKRTSDPYKFSVASSIFNSNTHKHTTVRESTTNVNRCWTMHMKVLGGPSSHTKKILGDSSGNTLSSTLYQPDDRGLLSCDLDFLPIERCPRERNNTCYLLGERNLIERAPWHREIFVELSQNETPLSVY